MDRRDFQVVLAGMAVAFTFGVISVGLAAAFGFAVRVFQWAS